MANPTPKPKIKSLQTPKGMHDILPKDQTLWDRIRKAVKDVGDYYNFLRIETPMVEFADLFERGVGRTTDIVEKEMFTVHSKSQDKLVLRPEGTAPVVRAYIQHGLSHLGQPLKLFYDGPMFRHENPQAGRLRQFQQAGYEIMGGEDDPIYDAQVILAAYRLLEELKITNVSIKVNTIGCKHCRPGYRSELTSYYKNKKKDLCKDCERRLAVNPLRLLDCKEEKCEALKKTAPIFIDHLCRNCHDHFKAVLEYLEELKLPYALDHYLVRGFDYYSKTVFEMTTEGFNFSIAGGGRYDYLTELLGGRSTAAVGVAIGLDRLIEVLIARNVSVVPKPRPKVFLIYVGALAKKRSLTLIETLRRAHIDVQESLGKESLKAQLRAADKFGAPLALLFGQKEAFEESVIVRDLATGAQETVPIVKMVESVKKRLR
jgi:histidyl-tRNA synthetase